MLLFIVSGLAQPGPIKNLRYNDDFSYLKNDSIIKKGLDKLKYRSLFNDTNSFWSLGGEIREWYEYRKNPNFGDLPPHITPDYDGSLQHRLMLHVDLQLNNRFRVFFQLNNTLEFGNPNPPIPEIIVDGLGIHQAFVDVNVGRKNNAVNHLRVGRQEFSFGSELLISSREGPNNRQPFDGISFIRNTSKYDVQLLLATPVIINPDVFDNSHIEEYLWGGYATLNKNKTHKIDAYYLGLYSEKRAYNYISGKQNRHTIGARFWNHLSKIYYDVDVMYQTGKFNAEYINAANVTAEARYVFKESKWKPMLGLGVSYITGDYHSSDGQLNTFDPYFPKPVYGLATPQGPSNIAHIRPIVGIEPLDKMFVNFSWYYLSRTSNQDGTYTPGMSQVRPIPSLTSNKYTVGTQYSLDVFYFINTHLTFITFLSYVEPGAYIQETGNGLDTFFWASTLQFKF
jgi:hypothetical protein